MRHLRKAVFLNTLKVTNNILLTIQAIMSALCSNKDKAGVVKDVLLKYYKEK